MATSPSRPFRSFTYPYTKVEWGSNSDIAPMAKAVLSWKGEKASVDMLMDTGANRTFLLSGMAERLGLEVSSETQTAMAGGGTLKVRRAKVEVTLMEPLPNGRIGRKHLVDPVLIAEEGALPFPVLGRKPFLRWYDLKLSERNLTFSLSEAP
jgi:predicted aspartyl protease